MSWRTDPGIFPNGLNNRKYRWFNRLQHYSGDGTERAVKIKGHLEVLIKSDMFDRCSPTTSSLPVFQMAGSENGIPEDASTCVFNILVKKTSWDHPLHPHMSVEFKRNRSGGKLHMFSVKLKFTSWKPSKAHHYCKGQHGHFDLQAACQS